MATAQASGTSIWSEARVCGACGAPEQRDEFDVYGKRFVRCGRCDLVRLRDRIDPAQLGLLYGNYYPLAARKPDPAVLQRELGNPTFAHRRKRLERHLARGERSMFELGAGDGNFLGYLRGHQWTVGGTEFSEETGALVRSRHGIELRIGDLGDIAKSAGPQPVVGAYHVIEHVYEPAEWLTLLRTLVVKGGLLHLQTPNFGSLDFQLAGTSFAMLSFPQHVYLYTPQILKRMLAEHGFETVDLTTYDPWHSPLTVVGSLGNLIKHKLTGRLPWPGYGAGTTGSDAGASVPLERHARPRPAVEAIRRVLYPLGVGIARLESAAGRGSVIDILARAV